MQSYSLLMLLVAIVGVIVWGYLDAKVNRREEPAGREADIGDANPLDQRTPK